jgi:GH24 family phage-related lysozyme (muramidase)
MNVLMLLIGMVLMAAPTLAQGTDSNTEIFIQKVKADKKLMVATNMDLSDAEAKKFWPLYEAYQKELEQLNQRLDKAIKDYAEEFNAGKGTISDDTATKLLNEALSLEEAEVKLKRTYADKIGTVLPATKTARYIQIENKIRALLKAELAQQIPLVY